ncbi:MAG: ATP-binding protein [Phycisphaerales bacterium]|nr:ATP-binding protein [Phycisphaerales bacterium]
MTAITHFFIGSLGIGGGLLAYWLRLAFERERRHAEQLAQAKASAEQANRAKDHFLAVLSHELRTPLTPILTTAALMEQDAALPEPLRNDIKLIRRNVELEAKLIDDLLDVTRIGRGKIELDRKPVLLRDVLEHAVEVCRSDMDARHVEFGVDLGGTGDILILADAARLQQAIWNLLKNAIKFTPPGGCVGIRVRSPSPDDAFVLIEINDSGVGVAPDVLPRLFSPFEQGSADITRQFGGLGLGLTITKGLIDMHGGCITLHSDGKGKGTSVRIQLPIYSLPPSAPGSAGGSLAEASVDNREANSQQNQEPTAKRILLVEDHLDTANVLHRVLTAEGHQVAITGNMAAALEMLSANPYDLLISDLGLPNGSGIDLMLETRRRGLTIPAIALSGYGQEEDIQRSKNAGFLLHLTKPVSIDRLTDAIRTVKKPEARSQ